MTATGITTTEVKEWESEKRNILDLLHIPECNIDGASYGYEYKCGLIISRNLVDVGVAIRDARGRYQPVSLLRELHISHHWKYPGNDHPWSIELTVDEWSHWSTVRDVRV